MLFGGTGVIQADGRQIAFPATGQAPLANLHASLLAAYGIEGTFGKNGSIFGDVVKLGLFFPAALTLLLLWLGGMWMWLYPFIGRRRVRRAKAIATVPEPRPREVVPTVRRTTGHG